MFPFKIVTKFFMKEYFRLSMAHFHSNQCSLTFLSSLKNSELLNLLFWWGLSSPSYEDRLISLNSIAWPPYSPDLNHCDYYYLKSNPYQLPCYNRAVKKEHYSLMSLRLFKQLSTISTLEFILF